MRARVSSLLALVFSVVSGCSSGGEVSSDVNPGVSAGSGGQPQDASTGGTAGEGGTGATGGGAAAGGQAGSGGDAGMGGTAGAGGDGGAAGSAGNAGDGGSGTAGAAGTGGTGGAGGSDGGVVNVPCTTDADCGGATSCQIAPDDAQTALELRCLSLAGSNGKGIQCATNADCRSGQCLYGFCAVPCSSSADCTQAGSCRTETVTSGGLSGDFSMCVVVPCLNSAECDPGEVCSDIRTVNGVMAAYCRQGNANGGQVGDACTAAADCSSALCPSWITFCTEACASDADCSAAPDLGCVNVYNDGTSIVQGCVPLCGKESDCAAPSTCAIATDTAGNRHRFTCSAGYGTDPVGADCSTANHCASGLCLKNYANGQLVDRICTAPCSDGASDCPVGFQVCADVVMQTPDGNGTEPLSLCNHP